MHETSIKTLCKQEPTSESVLIYNNFTDVIAVVIQKVLQVHLRRIVGVRAEDHAAVLPVKREVCHLSKWESQFNHLLREHY